MPKLVWDQTGERFYETGTDHAVLYPMASNGTYEAGVAWNGITGVTQSPSGADPNPLWADNIKYANPRSAEEFGATIEAYTYPEEWEACDGSARLGKGVTIGQQARKAFGFSYRSRIGNDVDGDSHGYKIHLIYNGTASPSERGYSTVNDSPDAITFSWEVTTTAIDVPGFRPTSLIEFDSTEMPKEFMTELEGILYGGDEASARLPLPEEIITLCQKYESNGAEG